MPPAALQGGADLNALAYIPPGVGGCSCSPSDAPYSATLLGLFVFFVVLSADVSQVRMRERCGLGLVLAGLLGASAWFALAWPNLGDYHNHGERLDLPTWLFLASVVGGLLLVAARPLIAFGHCLHNWDVAGPVYRRFAVPGQR